MTVTEAYLKKVKTQLPRVAKKDWVAFETFARNARAGSLLRFLVSLADCLIAKKASRLAYTLLVQHMVSYQLSVAGSFPFAAIFKQKIDQLLVTDLAQPKIKRFFPDFIGTPSLFWANYDSAPGIVGISRCLLLLGNWNNAKDLVIDTVGIARQLTRIRELHRAKHVYGVLKHGKKLNSSHREGLLLLRAFAEKSQLVATATELPELPNNLVEPSKDLKLICDAIILFPVCEALEEIEQAETKKLDMYLTDFQDFFQDYPIGEIRKKGLETFSSRCKSYGNLDRAE